MQTVAYRKMQCHVFCNRLDYMLTDLFSVFEKTQVWNGTQHVIPVFEKVMESLVKNMQAENGKSTTKQREKRCNLNVNVFQKTNTSHSSHLYLEPLLIITELNYITN